MKLTFTNVLMLILFLVVCFLMASGASAWTLLPIKRKSGEELKPDIDDVRFIVSFFSLFVAIGVLLIKIFVL